MVSQHTTVDVAHLRKKGREKERKHLCISMQRRTHTHSTPHYNSTQ